MADDEVVGHWINNKSEPAVEGGVMDVLNPLDDSLFAKVADGTAADVDKAVKAAHEAFQSYRETTPIEKEALLTKAAALLEEHRDEFVDLLIDEGGSAFRKTQFETNKGISFVRAAVGMVRQVSGKTLPTDFPPRVSMSWKVCW